MVRPPRDPGDDALLSNDGRLDPAKLDAAKRPRRRRKSRKLPDPAPELVEWGKGARKRANARPYPPGIISQPVGFDEEEWTSPHNDIDLHTLQLADAFGTRSTAVFITFMSQLAALCGKNHWDEQAQQWRLDEHEYSAALAIVNGLHPRNELEAAHAAQMVAIHLLTMKVTARAIRYEYDSRTASVAGRLARTFTAQREAFERIRKPNRTAKQSIKVTKELHQHVHYYSDRGAAPNSGQSDAKPAARVEELPALPSPNEEGRVVPITGRVRKARLPNARG
jgi:hypothetical protein